MNFRIRGGKTIMVLPDGSRAVGRREVTIDNRIYMATPVQYRVGLEGVPTTYYIGKDGKYLGSETFYTVDGRQSVIRVLPSDEATLLKLWRGAQLSKPQKSEVPALPDARK